MLLGWRQFLLSSFFKVIAVSMCTQDAETMDEATSGLSKIQAMTDGSSCIKSRNSRDLKGGGDVRIFSMFKHLLGNSQSYRANRLEAIAIVKFPKRSRNQIISASVSYPASMLVAY